MKQLSIHSFAFALLATCAAAHAQTVSGIKVEPAQIKAGEASTITVNFELKDDKVNCGMRVLFGDGQQQDIKINQKEDVPLIVKHTYAKAGQYQVKAAPQNMGMTFKCLGKEATAALVVVAPPVAVAPAPVQTPPARTGAAVAPPTGKTMAEPSCPSGFKLDAKSWNKKTQAYSCTAPKGSAMPTEKINCPGELAYYESRKTMKVGCKVE